MPDKELFKQHISQQFNSELEEIRTQLLEMGGLVEKQINDAIVALIEGDAKLAEQLGRRPRAMSSVGILAIMCGAWCRRRWMPLLVWIRIRRFR